MLITFLWYQIPWSQEQFWLCSFYRKYVWQHRWLVINAKRMGTENAVVNMMLPIMMIARMKVFAFWSNMNIIKIPIVSLFHNSIFINEYIPFWLDMRYCKEDTNLKPGYQCLKGSGRKFGYVCNEDLCNGGNDSRF